MHLYCLLCLLPSFFHQLKTSETTRRRSYRSLSYSLSEKPTSGAQNAAARDCRVMAAAVCGGDRQRSLWWFCYCRCTDYKRTALTSHSWSKWPEPAKNKFAWWDFTRFFNQMSAGVLLLPFPGLHTLQIQNMSNSCRNKYDQPISRIF